MAKYGDAAIAAVRSVQSGRTRTPQQAWDDAVQAIFPGKIASQKKGCPRGTFLGLCEDGFVRGIPPGNYSRSQLNKGYAIESVNLLRQNPNLARDSVKLWSTIQRGEEKVENGQMDVVLSLWSIGAINGA